MQLFGYDILPSVEVEKLRKLEGELLELKAKLNFRDVTIKKLKETIETSKVDDAYNAPWNEYFSPESLETLTDLPLNWLEPITKKELKSALYPADALNRYTTELVEAAKQQGNTTYSNAQASDAITAIQNRQYAEARLMLSYIAKRSLNNKRKPNKNKKAA